MLFKKETDYAIRVIRNLSIEKPTSISSILSKEHISEAIAHKVARKLDKGNLITSVRGSNGGYLLIRKLTDITLYDIYKVMEPNSFVSECLRGNASCPVNTGGEPCLIHAELSRIQNNLFNDLKSRSLADILDWEFQNS